MNNRASDAVRTAFNKRFADGEQYIEIAPDEEIVPVEKTYYWQEQTAYNRVRLIIDSYSHGLTDSQIYGPDGLVELLIPSQQAYNAVKNRQLELINRASLGVIVVEDGSVDTDELFEDGLAPGKVIVYRSGSNPPCVAARELNLDPYRELEEKLLSDMYSIAQEYHDAHANKE